jgi:flavin reductase (DIM6/NTAB) family NADH-FMN oxidoreductase RutF
VLINRVIKTPHVAESAFSMECELMHWYEIKNDAGESTNTVILGRIRRFHIVRVQRHYTLPLLAFLQGHRRGGSSGGSLISRTNTVSRGTSSSSHRKS